MRKDFYMEGKKFNDIKKAGLAGIFGNIFLLIFILFKMII